MENLENKINEYLQNQMMFGDRVTPFEMALQCIFTKWNGMDSYDGKEVDRNIILSECFSMEDITKCLNKHMSDWGFIKSPVWQSVYSR